MPNKTPKQLGLRKRGRPSTLTEDDIDRVLRHVVRYGNGPAIVYSKLSRSTIERLKRNRGFTGQRIYQPVIQDVERLGVEAASAKHDLSIGLVEDILKASGRWTDCPDRDIDDLLR